MPIYKLSKDDYQKIKADEQYGFLADNSNVDHGDYVTLALSNNAMTGLAERSGIQFEYFDKLNHVKPD